MQVTGIEVIRGTVNLAVPPGEKIELQTDDILRVNVGFDYRGDKHDFALYGAIGTRHPFPIGFDEILHGRRTISCPESVDFALVEGYVDIEITSGIASGTYDLYCKIQELPQITHELAGVIAVTRIAEEGIPWWVWAAVGVGGLIIVGGVIFVATKAPGVFLLPSAAAALTMPRKEEHHSSIVPTVAAATTLRLLEEERRKKKEEKPKGIRW